MNGARRPVTATAIFPSRVVRPKSSLAMQAMELDRKHGGVRSKDGSLYHNILLF